MTDKVELITTFKIDRDDLPSVSVVLERFSLAFAARGMSTKSWQEYAAYNSGWHWPSMKLLLDELSGVDVLYLENNESRSFATRHDNKRYILTVKLLDYTAEEPNKRGGIMGWIKDMLFGKSIIRSAPTTIDKDSDQLPDDQKAHWDESYIRWMFTDIVKNWESVNNGAEPEAVETKVLLIGGDTYLLRGMAATTPDEVIFAFLKNVWRDVFDEKYNAQPGRDTTAKSTLYNGVRLCLGVDDYGMENGSRVILAKLSPLNNEHTYTTTKGDGLGRFSYVEKTDRLDIELGPIVMQRLSLQFPTGSIMKVASHEPAAVVTLGSMGYVVAAGPHSDETMILTRLSKTK